MKNIKWLLLAIFLLLLSICLNVVYIGYIMPDFLHIISAILPIAAVIVVVWSFFGEK